MIIEAVKDVPFTPKRNADSTTALIFFYETSRDDSALRRQYGSHRLLTPPQHLSFYETSRDDSANEGLTLSQYVG